MTCTIRLALIYIFSAPLILTDETEMSVAVGGKVSLQVSVKGNPPPVVSWTVDGQEIGGDVTFETERNKHRMAINKSAIRNSGRYQVKAVNDWGEDAKDMVLNVLGKYKYNHGKHDS